MKTTTLHAAGAIALAISTLSPSMAGAQAWSWPAQPQNLQVLQGLDGEALSPVMRGFTQALGVRCNHCHVGEDGQPLSTFDFASDANPNKDRAREMLRMVESVREHLAKITPSGPARVEMNCQTCHRGRPRPLTLAAELREHYDAAGVEAAVQHYGDLKQRFHDRGAYDFGGSGLDALGRGLLQEGDVDGALVVLQLNADEHPESGRVWDSLAEAVLASGDRARAIELYRQALELDPRNRNARQRLEDLGGR